MRVSVSGAVERQCATFRSHCALRATLADQRGRLQCGDTDEWHRHCLIIQMSRDACVRQWERHAVRCRASVALRKPSNRGRRAVARRFVHACNASDRAGKSRPLTRVLHRRAACLLAERRSHARTSRTCGGASAAAPRAVIGRTVTAR